MISRVKASRFAQKALAVATAPATITGGLWSGNAAATKLKMRLGHFFAINSPIDEASKEFARLVGERFKGEITISVFPNNQLGGDEALGRELSRGSLELAFLNPGSLADLYPLLGIHYLPYVATNFKEVDTLFYNPDGILQKTWRSTLTTS